MTERDRLFPQREIKVFLCSKCCTRVSSQMLLSLILQSLDDILQPVPPNEKIGNWKIGNNQTVN